MEIKLYQKYNFVVFEYPNNSMIALNSNNSIISSMQQHFRSKSMKIVYIIHLFWYLQNLKFPQFKFLPTFVQCILPVTLWFGDSWQHDFRFPVATFVYVLLSAQTRKLRNQKWQVKKKLVKTQRHKIISLNILVLMKNLTL